MTTPTEREALLLHAEALLELFNHLSVILAPTDPVLTRIQAEYVDAMNKANNIPIGSVQPIDPARAQRIRDLIRRLRDARTNSAAVESLIQIATELAGEFGGMAG